MIKCGNCHDKHETVGEVRTCYGRGDGRDLKPQGHPSPLHDDGPVPVATLNNLGSAFAVEPGRDTVWCTWSNQEAELNVDDGGTGFCQYCGSTSHLPFSNYVADRARRTADLDFNPPTERQISYANKLLSERCSSEEAERTAHNWAAGITAGTFDKRAMSKVIEGLLAMPKTVTPASAPQPFPEVGEGRYAVKMEGVLKFYRVDRPTEGRWAGYTFVKVQASDDMFPVRVRANRDAVLAEIAKDPQSAMLRYGREIGSCGHCGRTLTNEESRARGIGPICASKMGW